MADVKVELADLVDVGTESEGCNDQPSLRLEIYSQCHNGHKSVGLLFKGDL